MLIKPTENGFIYISDTITGVKLTDVLVSTKLANSKREARQLILSGGIKIWNEKISDVNHCITFYTNDDINFGFVKINCGKQRVVFICVHLYNSPNVREILNPEDITMMQNGICNLTKEQLSEIFTRGNLIETALNPTQMLSDILNILKPAVSL